jgi:hypothetical protein
MKQGNGRVNFNGDEIGTYNGMYSRSNENENEEDLCNAIGVNIERSDLSEVFFSSLNVDMLQDAIRYGVYKASGGEYIISKQSIDELKIIMRSIYLQYGKNIPGEVKSEVRLLNGEVLKYSVGNVLSNVRMFKTFKRDMSKLPTPMARSQNSSTAGSKVLYFKEF